MSLKQCIEHFFEELGKILGLKQPICENCTVKFVRQYENKIQAIKTETEELQEYLNEQNEISNQIEFSKIDIHQFLNSTMDFFYEFYKVNYQVTILRKSFENEINEISVIDKKILKNQNLLNYCNFYYEKSTRDEIRYS